MLSRLLKNLNCSTIKMVLLYRENYIRKFLAPKRPATMASKVERKVVLAPVKQPKPVSNQNGTTRLKTIKILVQFSS